MARGQLIFKGDDIKKKTNKKSKHTKKTSRDDPQQSGGQQQVVVVVQNQLPFQDNDEVHDIKPTTYTAVQPVSASEQVVTSIKSSEKQQQQQPQIRDGTGQITTSGTVVTGHGTRFEQEIHIGDAILVQGEMRIVTMRLSNTSLNLSSPYTANVPYPVSFQYIPKPRTVSSNRKDAIKSYQTAFKQEEELKQHAFGTYATNNDTNEVVYRERTEHGSYRIKRENVTSSNKNNNNLTRSDLLQIRAKKTSDKYC